MGQGLVHLQASGWGGGHQPAHQVLGLRAHTFPLWSLKCVSGCAYLFKKRRIVKWWRPTQNNVQNHAQRPHVCLPTVAARSLRGVATLQNFRSKILRGTTERFETFASSALRQAEVCELYIHVRVTVHQQNVLGFQVPMHDVTGV